MEDPQQPQVQFGVHLALALVVVIPLSLLIQHFGAVVLSDGEFSFFGINFFELELPFILSLSYLLQPEKGPNVLQVEVARILVYNVLLVLGDLGGVYVLGVVGTGFSDIDVRLVQGLALVLILYFGEAHLRFVSP